MNDELTDGPGPVPPRSPTSEAQQEDSGIPPETPSEAQEPELAGPASPTEDEEPEGDDESAQEPPPEEDLPSINFNLDKQEAPTIYNIGVMMGPPDKPLFEEIPTTVIEQVDKLFVPPPLFSKVRLSNRTIVVSGPTHSGNFFVV
jgi:hypothetical protein